MIDDDEIRTEFWTEQKLTKAQLRAQVKALRALAIRVASKKCTCSMVQRLNGDGCEVCNPQMAIDLIMEDER